MNKFFAIITILVAGFSGAQAQEINLVADERVEWHQNEQKMVAVGNAIASKKDMSIRADTITALYDNAKDKPEQAKSKSQIKAVHAIGGVVMKTASANGLGDTMDYDVLADSMILKGKPATIKTDTETITATESITYYPSKQQAIALGDVVAVDAQKNKIYSDRMVSFFEKNAQGSLEMKKVEIYDNIKIVTKDAEVTADKGTYLPKEALIKLYDHVIISQNGNSLKGDYAITDMNTGISRLISKKGSGKRVSGVFKEKSKEKQDSKPETNFAPDSNKAVDQPVTYLTDPTETNKGK